MQRQLFFLFLILILFGCKETKPFENSAWQIEKVNTSNLFFITGAIAQFSDDNIIFYKEAKAARYPVIITENRLMIDTGVTKWLFEIVFVSDSNMVLRELYTNTPIEITLSRINNLKKKKL